MLQLQLVTTVFDSLREVIDLEQEKQVVLVDLLVTLVNQVCDLFAKNFRCNYVHTLYLRFYLEGPLVVYQSSSRRFLLCLMNHLLVLEQVALEQSVVQIASADFL